MVKGWQKVTGNIKHCNGCGKDLPLRYFGIDKSTFSGRKARCKNCVSANTRKWQRENPERDQEYKSKYGPEYRQGKRRKSKEAA